MLEHVNKINFKLDRSQSKMISAGITISLGIVKEIVDGSKTNNRFSWKDLVADLIGVTIGLVILEID